MLQKLRPFLAQYEGLGLGLFGAFPKNRDNLFGGPYNKDYNNLGSTLGSSLFWETTVSW